MEQSKSDSVRSKSSKIKYFTVAIAVGVTLLGVFLYFTSSSEDSWAQVKRGPVEYLVYGLGTVKTDQVFEYKPTLPLRVSKVHVTEGDRVKTGDPLLSFDLGPLIRAPFSGVLTRLSLREGENAPSGFMVLRLEDWSNLFVELVLEQTSAFRIQPGQKAKMSFEVDRSLSFDGEVVSLYPQAGQFVVRVKFLSDWPRWTVPSMTLDVAVFAGKSEDSLLIPARAFKSGAVTRKRGTLISEVPIKLGGVSGDWVEVISGDLEVGDQVKALPK